MKRCSLCKKDKSVEEFNKNKIKVDGLQTFCRTCQRSKYREYYASDPREKERLRVSNKRIVADRKAMIKGKKEVPCVDCRKKYPYYVMDFDHLEDKDFQISTMGHIVSKERLEKEINKCEVVCSNCHRIRSHNRMQSRLV